MLNIKAPQQNANIRDSDVAAVQSIHTCNKFHCIFCYRIRFKVVDKTGAKTFSIYVNLHGLDGKFGNYTEQLKMNFTQ